MSQGGGKQVDPVNFSRLEESWRTELKEYVSRLIKLRTTHAALAVNDTEFLGLRYGRSPESQRGVSGAELADDPYRYGMARGDPGARRSG